jgi:hypothetical protein
MAANPSDIARKATFNRLFTDRQASAHDILAADFGHWPPKGLSIAHVPEISVTFNKMFSIHPGFMGYTSNDTPQKIEVNIWSLLPRLFNRASAALTETISHENIHVIQNTLSGTIAPHGEQDHPNSYRAYLTNIIPPIYLQSVAHLREIQPRLHGVIAEHYRRRQMLPGNTADLFALLRAEKIIGESAYVDDLLENSFEGRWAKKNFPADSGRLGSRLQDAADLWLFFVLMRKEKHDEFYEKILPGIYGRLLELYGDEFGCMRMGYNYNTLTNETLLRQAQADDLTGMEKTVASMPLSQAGSLMNDLMRSVSWKDKTTGNIHRIAPEKAEILTNLLYKHTAPPNYSSKDLQIRP